MRNLKFILLLICFISIGKASCPGRDCYKEKKIEIQGILLVKAGKDLSSLKRRKGITILVEKIDNPSLRQLLCSYLGDSLDQATVQSLKNDLLQFLHKNQILAMITIPEQEVSDGTVVLEVLFSKVGEVSFEGQKWISSSYLEKSIHLYPGEPLDQVQLLNDLAFLNRNMFRRTEVVLSPGKEEGTTNLEFFTKDRVPVRLYVGIENTGLRITDRWRLFEGVCWGNAFGRGDILNYQYTSSTDFQKFQAHSATYTSYLPWKHLVFLSANYGEIRPRMVNFKSHGKSVDLSLRYQIPIKPLYRSFQSMGEVGFNYKYLNTNLFFTGGEQNRAILIHSIPITQLLGSYSLRYQKGRYRVNFQKEIIGSLWKRLFPHQTNKDYRVLRPKSYVRYLYFKKTLGYRYQIPQHLGFSLLLKGQVATGALPSSEQFSLGGASTVRGYHPSQFLSDNAICLNVEVYFPSFSLIKRKKDRITFLGFYDMGFGHNYKKDSFSKQCLEGVGPALRYEMGPYFSCRADYGFQLRKPKGEPSRLGHFYLSSSISY